MSEDINKEAEAMTDVDIQCETTFVSTTLTFKISGEGPKVEGLVAKLREYGEKLAAGRCTKCHSGWLFYSPNWRRALPCDECDDGAYQAEKIQRARESDEAQGIKGWGEDTEASEIEASEKSLLQGTETEDIITCGGLTASPPPRRGIHDESLE